MSDLATRLIRASAVARLASYASSLRFAAETLEKGWIPSEDAPRVPGWIETLAAHLSGKGIDASDRFLLRYALVFPGRLKGIVPPIDLLEENRGGFSPRRVSEAAAQYVRLSEALGIARRYLPDLPETTPELLRALVELSRSTPPTSDAIIEWIGSMSRADGDLAAVEITERIANGGPTDREILSPAAEYLACLRDVGLPEAAHEILLGADVIAPATLYRDATDRIARSLIERLDTAESPREADRLLQSIAWTRSATAADAFRDWDAVPPAWVGMLNVRPSGYAETAGWCLASYGSTRELVFPMCRRLRIGEGTSPIACRVPAEGTCPGCGGRLSFLFDFGAGHPPWIPSRIPCCPACSCFTPSHARHERDGGFTLTRPESVVEHSRPFDYEPTQRIVSDALPPFAATIRGFLEDSSVIGGAPPWFDDVSYPRCLDCGESMSFVAAHDNGPLSEEGIFLAFVCRSCLTTAVSYQQS